MGSITFSSLIISSNITNSQNNLKLTSFYSVNINNIKQRIVFYWFKNINTKQYKLYYYDNNNHLLKNTYNFTNITYFNTYFNNEKPSNFHIMIGRYYRGYYNIYTYTDYYECYFNLDVPVCDYQNAVSISNKNRQTIGILNNYFFIFYLDITGERSLNKMQISS